MPEDPKSLSRERFDRFAQRYVSSATHAEAPELERLLEIAQPENHWMVLDIATGGGHTALKFAPYVCQVIASDIATGMIEAAREFITGHGVGNVIYGLADSEQLPFKGSTFDLVTCRVAAHHFYRADLFVMESARVLKTGGALLIEDHVLPEDKAVAAYIESFEKLRDPSHHQAFSAAEWRHMFRESGLQMLKDETVLKVHMFYEWALRQSPTRGVLKSLEEMVGRAPAQVLEWMQPEDFGSERAAFVNYHILIYGRKHENGEKR